MGDLETTYNPKSYEKKWSDFWLANRFFHAPIDPKKKPYTVLMPPPNVTAQLHMGHGTCFSFQDLLIRFKRMQGFNACWLPGTDHAGIATQMMVEKDLWEKEKKRKTDLGREAFVSRCHAWKDKYGGLIYEQFASIGFSADWDRSAYTMDQDLSKAVRYVFVKLYEEDLIYRGERLINWDPDLKTAVSDDEVESKEIQGSLYYFRYPVVGSDEQLLIATTRPETMLGDTAVAVNPNDERYRHLIGKKIRLPLVGREIPIIGDEYVKSEFGSGVVKITPAHDPNDFEIGRRHKLPFVEIFNDDATLNNSVPERFRGLDRFVARKEVIKALKELSFFEKEQSYHHNVPHSDRSKSIIEPKLSKQWFVRMRSLAEQGVKAALENRVRFYPENWKKTYLYWLENIQDWCISRQLWWGHQIPIWYCQDCQHVNTGIEDPKECRVCHSKSLKQDEDVLDTWFSSWLWPLSPFGWPDEAKEKEKGFDYFYPSQVLVTGPDIIFLWVARMVMAGLKFKAEVPFKDIYLSAIVTDKQGKKFSKTLGNGIDPLEVIDQYGADAVRFTSISMAPLGGRIMMDKGDFENGARFANKIWNASRFLLSNIDQSRTIKKLSDVELDVPSRWLLSEFHTTVSKVINFFDSYRFNEGVDAIYHFIWGSFCDWGLECAKGALQGKDLEKKDAVISVLLYVLEGSLRMIHPVMPFISEELWQKIPVHPDWPRTLSIVIAEYPKPENIPTFSKDAQAWQYVTDLISAVRSARQQVGITPKQTLDLHIEAKAEVWNEFDHARLWIQRLANIGQITHVAPEQASQRPKQSLCAVGKLFQCYIPVAGLVDLEKERVRLKNESDRIRKIVEGISRKLSNDQFVAKAPQEVVRQNQAQKDNLEQQLHALEENLKLLSH